MQNRQKALNLIGLAMRAGKVISGTDTVLADLKKNKVKVIILANDLHENSSEKIARAAQNAKVEVINIFTAQEIAHAIGKDRKVLALTDAGFYKALTKKINEGV